MPLNFNLAFVVFASIIYFLLKFKAFIYFSRLIAMVMNSRTMLNRKGENGHSCSPSQDTI